MDFQKRAAFVYFIFLFLISILILRLFVLSQGNLAQEILSGQYTRKYEIASGRGFFYDRGGVILDGQKTGYAAFVNPSKVAASAGYAAAFLSGYTDSVSEPALYALIKAGAPFRISLTERLQTEWVKSFPVYERGRGSLARHLIGYTDAAGIGVMGLEKVYDSPLSGRFSGSVYARYRADAKMGALYGEEPVIFDDRYLEKNGIVLTIDRQIQQKAEQTADRHIGSGALVVADIANGEILALLSRPVYDTENLGQYLHSGGGEFLNRALCAFTPGSIFKIIVAAAALENDISLRDFTYDCEGHIDVSGETFNCHKKDGHGALAMREAFANSCNTYFIALAQKTGYAKILETARRIGVGESVDLDGLMCGRGMLPEDSHVPPALIANTAIGQGSILLTPLEAIKLISAAATGKIYEPTIVRAIYEGGRQQAPGGHKGRTVFEPEIVSELRGMLFSCVENGTGMRAKPSAGLAGGKTATAQTGQKKDEKELTHLWFAGVYPLDHPKYAIVALCDANAAVEGGRSPQDAFREICEYLGEKED